SSTSAQADSGGRFTQLLTWQDDDVVRFGDSPLPPERAFSCRQALSGGDGMRMCFVAAALAAAVLFSGGGVAQAAACAERAALVGALAQRYGEAPVGVGLASDGALVEVLASGDGA